MKIKESQLRKLHEAGLLEGFFARLKRDIQKLSDKKIQSIIDKGNEEVADFIKDFKKNPNKYMKYDRELGF
ncbi:hypothetical protein HOC32_03770 [Candidatus Woesearchaeota archaeon]|jgi:hypothetical protein|nr:hypothetical protein [Candidatus Woesearchaeota archaeon]